MAYISTERVKEIRQELKAKFPNVKFSVTTDHSTVTISIMESPFEWSKEHIDINVYYPETYENSEFLTQIIEIAKNGVTTRETSDYGNQPSFYVDLNVGKWNKPHKKI